MAEVKLPPHIKVSPEGMFLDASGNEASSSTDLGSIVDALQDALREALDAWERAEAEAIRATASAAQAEIDIKNSEDLARVRELREAFLGEKR